MTKINNKSNMSKKQSIESTSLNRPFHGRFWFNNHSKIIEAAINLTFFALTIISHLCQR